MNRIASESAPTVRLVTMTAADATAFLAAVTPAYVAERAAADHLSAADAEQFVHEQHARVLPQGPATPGHAFRHIVAAAAPATVGGLWLFREPGSTQAFVYYLTIWPEFRRRGLARAALLAVEAELRAAGCATLALNVFSTNPGAQRLYAAVGFAVVSSHMNKRL